jgi:hypothetical protein
MRFAWIVVCRSVRAVNDPLLPFHLHGSRSPAIRILSSIGEVCGPMRVNPEQLAVRYYCDDLAFESFRELLSARSKRAMTALR